MCYKKNTSGCQCDQVVNLTVDQTETNSQIVVPVAAKNEYQLALESGEIDPDVTLSEWLNRPSKLANKLIEKGENI